MPDTNLDVRLVLPERKDGIKKYTMKKRFGLTEALRFVEDKPLEEETKKKLIALVKTFPEGTYEKFCTDIQRYIELIRRANNRRVTTFDAEDGPNGQTTGNQAQGKSASNSQTEEVSSRPVRQPIVLDGGDGDNL